MDQTDPIALLEALVRRPSITPDDAGALDLLEAWLVPLGFAVHRLAFSSSGARSVPNLYARLGVRPPFLVFAGHVDVVPPGDPASWRFPPFSATRADGAIWGRGSVDMKGGVCASVAAVARHVAAHGPPQGSIGFLITADEEGPAVDGTAKLIEWASARGERPDHCILGEPSCVERLGDTVKIGRRGSLTGRLTVHGVQGHVAYPHLSHNPVYALARAALALKDRPIDEGTAHFAASNLEITTIAGGDVADNVTPGEAYCVFNCRFNDLWSPETLRLELGARVAAALGDERFSLDFASTNAAAFLTAPGPFAALVTEAVRSMTGLTPDPSTAGGTSDARFIAPVCPVVEFGLVNKTIHAIDERAPIADVEALTTVYQAILGGYFSDGSIIA